MGRGGREGYRIAVVTYTGARAAIEPLVVERLAEDEQFQSLDEILVRR